MLPALQNPAVAQKFAAYPPAVRAKLLALRKLIFSVAAQTPGVGPLDETLKWGEPAYLTAATRAGSTVRLDWKPKNPGQYALYFHCQTNLVATFRTLFAGELAFDGNRAIVLDLASSPPEDALTVCVHAALTYHLNRHAGQRTRRQPVPLPGPGSGDASTGGSPSSTQALSRV